MHLLKPVKSFGRLLPESVYLIAVDDELESLLIEPGVVQQVCSEFLSERDSLLLIDGLLRFFRVLVFALAVVKVHRQVVHKAKGSHGFLMACEDVEVYRLCSKLMHLDRHSESLCFCHRFRVVELALDIVLVCRQYAHIVWLRRNYEGWSTRLERGVLALHAFFEHAEIDGSCNDFACTEERARVKAVSEALEDLSIGVYSLTVSAINLDAFERCHQSLAFNCDEM